MSDSVNERKTQENEHVPGDTYIGVLIKVYKNPPLAALLRLVSTLAVLFSVFVFALTLATSDIRRAIELAVISAVPFIAVSIIRRAINAPRPYELLGIYETAPKKKSGESFPSRHVFSAFLIATVAMPTYPILAAVLMLLGAALATARVLLGIHFLRDVLTGAIIGAISGGIGLLVLFLI